MRTVHLALAIVLTTGLSANAGPDSTATYDALPYHDTFDDFEPRPEDLSLIAMLANAEGGWQVLKNLPAEDRTRLLRTGLRLPTGPQAAWCASWCDADTLDLAEHQVGTDLIVAEFVARPDEWRGGLWNLLEHFSGAQVRSIIERLSPVPTRLLDEGSFSTLHKVMRPDALPVLADLLGPLEGQAPVGMEEVVWLHAWHTDRHRDAVGRVLLGDTRSAGLSAEGPGVPPLLRASLDEILSHDEDDRGYEVRYTSWALRWLRDVKPAEANVSWLVELAWSAEPIAAWSLRHLDDEGSLLALHDLAGLTDDAAGEDEIVARAALAARGDAQALEALRANAADAEDPDVEIAMAFLLELDPGPAVDDLLARLLAADGELDEYDEPAWWDVVGDVDEARWEHRLVYGLSWGPEAFAGFEERMLASDASADLLHAVATGVPGCATRRMAEEVLARCGDEPLLFIASSFLEHGAPDAYRARLREWAGSGDDDLRAEALRALLAIGDPESGSLLVDAMRNGPLVEDAPVGALARSPCDAVRAYLRECATAGDPNDDDDLETQWIALAALAEIDGLPEGVELAPWYEDRDVGDRFALPDEDLDAVRGLVLEGRPIEAFVRLVEASPDDLRWRAGDVRDPRVTAYLRGLQAKRHLELYPWATAELAIQGDPEARAETWQALRQGSYRWCDELDARQRTMGFDLGTLPLWADFFESSCCQFPTARIVFDDLFSAEPAFDKGQGFTGRAWAHRWLSEHDGPFAWSHIEEQFVPTPR